ncbi:MAG TPA: immunoglobulin domain-containing protein [Candidatus Paceibacterota bacterium]|nr:immunoglobulin domain-containing protein [Candidatus Paceibacterota bacterium]
MMERVRVSRSKCRALWFFRLGRLLGGVVFVLTAGGVSEAHAQILISRGYPPLVIKEPLDQTLAEGSTLALAARVTGSEPLRYQWYFNGLPITRANNYSLVISNAPSERSGNYYLLASNYFGKTTSRVAQVRILEPLRVLQSLLTTNLSLGRQNVLSVDTAGSKPLRIQWRLNGVNIPGGTNATFVLPSVRPADGGRYSVLLVYEAGVVMKEVAELGLGIHEVMGADFFAERTLLRHSDLVVRSANVKASREKGEPAHAGKPGGKSIWFSWRAPMTGWATFTTAGSDFDTLLAVYTGLKIDDLTLEAANEDSGGSLTSKVQFMASAGEVYQIAVDGFAGASGRVVLGWDLQTAVTTAPQIVREPRSQFVAQGGVARFSVGVRQLGLRYQWYFHNRPLLNATDSTLILNNVQPGHAGIYHALISGKERISSSVPVRLEVYRVEAGDPGLLGPGEDKLEDLVLKTEDGQAIVRPLQGPAFGERMSAAPSSGYTVVRWGSSVGGSTQTYETGACGQMGGASIWYRLVLTQTGICTVSTEGSNFDTLLAVFRETGDLMNPLSSPVTCNDNGGADGKTSRLQLPCEKPGAYFVLVDGVDGASGQVQLTVTLEPWVEVKSVGIQSAGWFGFELGIPKDWLFRIDGGTAFSDWSPLLSTNSKQGSIQFNDEDWALFGQRFYRIVPVQ